MVIFLVFDVAYYTSLAMRKHWPRVGVRVLGFWIISISLMVLALLCSRPDRKRPFSKLSLLIGRPSGPEVLLIVPRAPETLS